MRVERRLTNVSVPLYGLVDLLPQGLALHVVGFYRQQQVYLISLYGLVRGWLLGRERAGMDAQARGSSWPVPGCHDAT